MKKEKKKKEHDKRARDFRLVARKGNNFSKEDANEAERHNKCSIEGRLLLLLIKQETVEH